ncbi:MAG: hypothetical protein K2X66_14660, partial [Cyanobacteria bacterium]|nr:hypothetical protein [Cyanobacteriota bacterium]
EALEQFSLKQINSLLIKSNLTPVNHSVVENALAKGFIEMVPDLTGMAEVTEYILTVDGGVSGKSTAEKLFS